MSDPIDTLLAALAERALRYPEVIEGVSCAGTAIESRTVLTGKRAFVFLRHKEVRFKLRDTLPEMAALASAEPERYEAGKGGWCKVVLEAGADPSTEQWRRWIDESFRLMATKTRIRKLDAGPLL